MVENFLGHFFKEFIQLLTMSAPYLVIGVIAGALFNTYFKADIIEKVFLKSKFSIFIAAILGGLLPGCAMTTIPMALSLRKKGVAIATLGAFIFVAPLLSPHTLILSWGVLGARFTLARLLFSLSGAILLGYLLLFLEKRSFLSFNSDLVETPDQPHCRNCKTEESQTFAQSLLSISKDLGKYFLIGAIIASFLTAATPKTFAEHYLTGTGIMAYLIAAIAGIPMYVCEGEEIPLTLSLLKLGVQVGPAMTFMLGALGTCIPTIVMTQKIIGKKATLIYVVYWFIFAIASGWLFQILH